MTDYVVRRRILTKVRRSFIHKRPDNEDINAGFGPQQPINDGEIRMIDPAIGLVERNGKICAGVRFINSYITINNLQIHNQHNHKAVSFNIQLNENPLPPWEYYVKQLESSGDLSLATWAQRIRYHHSHFPQVMAQYLARAKSNDVNTIANLRKAKNQVMLVHREIESSYPYKRVTLFADGAKVVPISASYSESLLKIMGRSLESFFDVVKESGIPTLFGGECPYHMNMAGAFLDCSMLQADPVKYEDECLTYLYDKDGRKRTVVVQPISLVEPASEGLFLTGYLVIKNVDVQVNAFETDIRSPKLFKEENTLENLTFSHEE